MISAEGKISPVQVISRKRLKSVGPSSLNWRVVCASRMRLILFLLVCETIMDDGIPCNGPAVAFVFPFVVKDCV